ncbi:hypothetical protein COCNU_contig69280848G000010 [Cocos nucifera]|nr:hypothetical protein [Cocos nucifera]
MASSGTEKIEAKNKEIDTKSLPSPRGSGGGGQCLCSPTTHEGSFRCRFHRSLSSNWMRRSKSVSSSGKSTTDSVISKPLETA